MDEDIIFLDDDAAEDSASVDGVVPWKILIVDDEPDVHVATKLALKGFEFDRRPLEFASAFSASEAREKLRAEAGYALILLDVVMESDDAGLALVDFIRSDLGYQSVRIVLRTGQPGQAPEREVIVKYDINDYKEKTDLSSTKLFTLVYSVLRSYRDIRIIEASRKGLERVIDSSALMFREQFIDNFAHGVLEQVSSLVMGGHEVAFSLQDAAAATHEREELKLVAGTGRYEDFVGRSAHVIFPVEALEFVEKGRARGPGEYGCWIDGGYVGMVVGDKGRASILYLDAAGEPGTLDTHLIDIFVRNVLIAVENLYLRNALVDTQREVVYRLSEAVETRSQETGNHVKRVAEISKLLGLELGMDDHAAEVLRLASPLHDIGKVGIPDAILNKPGRLEEAEMKVMRSHAELGYNILKDSEREILQVGADIAYQHHEMWNGKGYPQGLSGEDICIEARITAVADVFDALSCERCYKDAWSQDKVLAYLQAESGSQFDPRVVSALLENLDAVNTICARFSGIREKG
jgi:response regulator RpfG family c-di-GMP phosphodiesterase